MSDDNDNQLGLFTGEEGKRRRDQALAAVAEKSGVFMDDALAWLVNLLPNGFYTGEMIRERIEAAGIKPHHHNAWGAVIACAVRNKHIYPTGRYVCTLAPKKHARKTQVYRRGGEA